MIPQMKRTAGDLGSIVANWLNSKGLRAAVASEITKKVVTRLHLPSHNAS